MFDDLIQFYYDYFTDEKNDGWVLIGSSVCLIILNELYSMFLRNNEITPLDNIETSKKIKYWEISKRFYSETEQRIRAAKAAYILELITSNE